MLDWYCYFTCVVESDLNTIVTVEKHYSGLEHYQNGYLTYILLGKKQVQCITDFHSSCAQNHGCQDTVAWYYTYSTEKQSLLTTVFLK